MPVPLLQMSAISKRFPGVVALDRVDFDVAAGEIVALVGENGAGKSTLMKILAGIHRADSGEIRIDGAPVAMHGPADAARLGIGVIHQERELIDTLDVAGNVFLGREPHARRPAAAARSPADAGRHRAPAGAHRRRSCRARTPLGRLSAAQQQLVAIARALSMNARLLILDEPTSSLDVERRRTAVRRAARSAVRRNRHRLHLASAEGDRERSPTVRSCSGTGGTPGRSQREAISHDRLVQLMVGRAVAA